MNNKYYNNAGESHTQRVIIVINSNIIEQVTDFKYWDTVYQNTKVI